jgi:ParB-like chromosome segregation protein Spo0J
MSTKLSVEDVLATLEARAIHHRDREAFHAQQEAHHREQRTLHAAELAKVEESLESFRVAAPKALELARERIGPPEERAADLSQEDVAASGRTPESRRIRRAVASWNAEEPFGPTAVAGEVNRRHRGALKKPVDARAVSNVLRRMHTEGKLHLVRPGKAFHEALYRRGGG